MEEKIKIQFKSLVLLLEHLINLTEETGFVNEQWFLDYMDEINKLSVKY